MIANPKVTSKPITLASTGKVEEVIPGIFHSCTMGQAIANEAPE